MTPSKEAIEAFKRGRIMKVQLFKSGPTYFVLETDIPAGLEAYIVVDVAPLEARVKELEHNLEMRRLVSDDIGRERDRWWGKAIERAQRIAELEADIRSCSAWSAHLQMDLETSGEIIKKLEAENQRLKEQLESLVQADYENTKSESDRLKSQLEGR